MEPIEQTRTQTRTQSEPQSRPRLTRIVLALPGEPVQEFWAHDFIVSEQDGGRTLKLFGQGSPEQVAAARAQARRELARSLAESSRQDR